MQSSFMHARFRRAWWWMFSALVAGPAVVLAVFGLRAVRADRIEREHQLRELETQTARLADAALANAIERMTVLLDRISPDGFGTPQQPPQKDLDLPFFLLDRGDVLSFPSRRIYFGPIGRKPQFLEIPARLAPNVSQLIWDAQAREAQERMPEAIALYRQARLHPLLKDWASLALDRLQEEPDPILRNQRLADPLRGRSDATTPMGIPVAIVASSGVEQVEPGRRRLFAPLLKQTLESLRKDFWWLSFEERQHYESFLRHWLQMADVAVDAVPDTSLDELARAEPAIRRASQRDGAPYLETQAERDFVIIWSRVPRDGGAVGAVLSGPVLQEFLDGALKPVFQGQPFTATLRETNGRPLWNPVRAGGKPWRTESLSVVHGLQLDFTAPEAGSVTRNQWMGYGVVLLPMLLLVIGVVMTVQVIRQEVALNDMQTRFIAAVSHELKSPLTGIRLLLERMAGGRLNEPGETRAYHQAIERETDRLETLVDRLLESQALQSACREYSFETAALNTIAHSAIERLRPQAEAKGIRLIADMAAGVPELPLDKTAIRAAIENLLDNAIKYSPAGTEVSIHIRSTHGEAQIEVCDRGIGIEKADLLRIFDPFYRGHRGDMENVKGTGLGLALVKAAAEAHGGKVDVSSAPNSGSRFTLRFPITEHT